MYVMSYSLTIIIVDKNASLKNLNVKDYKIEELYKKAGFKKADGFKLHVEWPVKIDGRSLIIQMYGKLDGKANMENKYDFPPPIDTKLFFGSCVLVGKMKDASNNISHINLPIELWNKIYEKLFGGFEDLVVEDLVVEDEDDEDELENVPKNMKTKATGYLKDGFVVDNSDAECSGTDSDDEADEKHSIDITDSGVDIEEYIGSELSEEAYDYSDNE